MIQNFFSQGFDQTIVHPFPDAKISVGGESEGGDGDDRDVDAELPFHLYFSDHFRGFETIQAGHMTVHENEII